MVTCNCGKRFPTRPNPIRDLHERLCDECYTTDENEWKKIEQQFASHLSEKNRIVFIKMEIALRRGIVLEAIDDGVITYKINRA